MKTYPKQYIYGEWVEGTGSSMISDINPFTGDTIYEYRSASINDVDKAYAAAKAAQKEWAAKGPSEQAAAIEKLIAAIQETKDDLYEILAVEGGSVKGKGDFEFFTSISIVQNALRYPALMQGKILPSDIPGKDNYVCRSPRGVIGVITPWNVPIVLAMRSVIPAIATGNAVVLKPSTDTPAAAFLIAEWFERAGMPQGLFNVVSGKGSEIGDYFVEHPIPDLISFTGSTEVGKRIGELAGKSIKEVSLELGGNNAMIVLEDADIDHAAAAAAFGSYYHQGQICMAINRILVPKAIYNDFTKAFVKAVSLLPVGDPLDENTFIGPIINESQVTQVEGYIEATKQAGATVLLEGKTEGNLISPWVFGDVTNDMPAAKNEVFGPVTSLICVSSEEEAIAIANDTTYGLSGSVFTTDLYHGMQVAKQIESGMVHVNDQSINDEPHVMFGGEKESGLGRFNGEWVLEKFTTQKWISVQTQYRF